MDISMCQQARRWDHEDKERDRQILPILPDSKIDEGENGFYVYGQDEHHNAQSHQSDGQARR